MEIPDPIPTSSVTETLLWSCKKFKITRGYIIPELSSFSEWYRNFVSQSNIYIYIYIYPKHRNMRLGYITSTNWDRVPTARWKSTRLLEPWTRMPSRHTRWPTGGPWPPIPTPDRRMPWELFGRACRSWLSLSQGTGTSHSSRSVVLTSSSGTALLTSLEMASTELVLPGMCAITYSCSSSIMRHRVTLLLALALLM